MRKKHNFSQHESSRSYSLLSALSDDLALPLVQIKTSIESFEAGRLDDSLQKIALSVDNGLQLIEAYRLVLKSDAYSHLQYEPVAIGAILQAVANQLIPYAKKYDTRLQIDIQGRLTPVLAHQPSLFAAMGVLSSSLIRAQAAQSSRRQKMIILGAHKTADNVISAGVFGDIDGLSDQALKTARALVGQAKQPLPGLPAGAASGVLIADMLCASMWRPLRAAAHNGLHGLATLVPVSKQLQFV